MKIAGSVALVTGANRGPGRVHTTELVSLDAALELIYPPVQEFWDAAAQGSH